MNKLQHQLYISFFVVVTILVTALLVYNGYTYYSSPIEERFFLDNHSLLRPTGFLGHGLGIIGSLLMVFGVLIYMIRKRVKTFMRIGLLKHWLELHIFLCTLGPIMVLFHTAFKFGGIVAVSFWSMVAVFLSGIIGRFIYIRIPHTIEGEEMNMNQINNLNSNLSLKLATQYNLNSEILSQIEELIIIERKGQASFISLLKSFIPDFFEKAKRKKNVNNLLKSNNVVKKDRKEIIKIVKEKSKMANRIYYLRLMQSLFKYWHVAHLPFAIIMLIIMMIHVIVTVSLGYRWIF